MPSVEGVDDNVPQKGYGVRGNSNSYDGVRGISWAGTGVWGSSAFYYGVYGNSYFREGVRGHSYEAEGVRGHSVRGYGLYGSTNSGYAAYLDGRVFIQSKTGFGVRAFSEQSIGIDAWGYPGVYGSSDYGPGVFGRSNSSHGVAGYSSSGYGIYGSTFSGLAALLDGNVRINGDVHVTGKINKAAVQFKIDHPLDPANKYLYHSCVESLDMKNVYDGMVALDNKGEAEIELPDWFGALNKDFRYQLTAIGAPGPNLYIAEEISEATTNTKYSSKSNNKNSNSRFRIAGGVSGMKVSWQVTGIRKDPWANANRIQVEEEKPAKERGYYLHPDLYRQPEEKGISHLLFPKDKREDALARPVHK